MPYSKKYSVLLCTDEPTRAVGFRKCFDSHPEFLALPCVPNARRLTELMASTFLHVVVLHSKAQTAKRVLAFVRDMKLGTKVILWPTEIAPVVAGELTKHGLASLLGRGVEPEELVSVVRRVARGEQILSVARVHASGRSAGATVS